MVDGCLFRDHREFIVVAHKHLRAGDSFAQGVRREGDDLLSRMEHSKITYLCGVPLSPTIKNLLVNLGEAGWQPCLDDKDGDVAEFGYRMSASDRFPR
jgi:hypothetical protein